MKLPRSRSRQSVRLLSTVLLATCLSTQASALTLEKGAQQSFTAEVLDQFGDPITGTTETINWSQTGGSLSSTTGTSVTYTAGSVEGTDFYIRADAAPSGFSDQETIVIIEPTIPPVVSITSPGNGDEFFEGQRTTITADASDPDGTINEVRFYNGGTLIGTATSAPYEVSWNAGPLGNQTLTAIAQDNSLAETTSAGVTVNVIELDGGPFPVADTWVDQNEPTRKRGSHSELRLSNNPRYAYLKFDLNWIQAPVSAAALKVKIKKWPTTADYSLYFVSDDSWQEGSVDWNTKPADPSTAALITTAPGQPIGEWVEFDVSSILESERLGDGILSVMIFAPSGWLHSKEAASSSDHPILEITTSNPSTTFDTWMQSQGITDPALDNNSNGVKDIFDFLFANDLITDSTGTGMGAVTMTTDIPVNSDDRYLYCEMVVRTVTDGMTYGFEYSQDGLGWDPVDNAIIEIVSTDGDTKTIGVKLPLGGISPYLVRIVASMD